MNKPKITAMILFTLFISVAVVAQTVRDMPPKLSVVPVEHDAPWAVEWWRVRHDEKVALAKAAEIDVLFIGDSITHGWENEGAAVWQEYYESRNAFNLGFSGDRTEHVLWRLENGGIDNMEPALVILMIGTNNTGHRMDPAAYTAEGIERIVGKLRQQLPGTEVLILGIFPRHISPYNEMRRRNAEINERISALANNDTIHYLDIGSSFLNDDGTLRQEVMPDLLHLNPDGYRIWAEAIEPTLTGLLQD